MYEISKCEIVNKNDLCPNLSSCSKTVNILRLKLSKAVGRPHHPPVVDDVGSTPNSIRPLQTDLPSPLSGLSIELPALKIVGGEVRVRFIRSALYFLAAAC